MTPTQQRLFNIVQRRAGNLSGSLTSQILRAHQRIAESYTDAEIVRLIETGQIDRLIAEAFSDTMLNTAYAPVRDKMRQGVFDTARYFGKNDIPKLKGVMGSAFDTLSPHVIEGITQLESKVITGLRDNTRELVRAHVENGLRDGVGPKAIARNLRPMIGLAPNQLEAVENYRKALEEGKVGKALGYKLRDKRLKVTDSMTPDQIEKSVAAYRGRWIKHNAETHARTAALDSQKLAQQLSWEQAIKDGIVDESRLFKRWIQVDRPTKREEHVLLHGQVVPFFAPYSNGEIVPGESTWNCACLSQVFQQRAA